MTIIDLGLLIRYTRFLYIIQLLFYRKKKKIFTEHKGQSEYHFYFKSHLIHTFTESKDSNMVVSNHVNSDHVPSFSCLDV